LGQEASKCLTRRGCRTNFPLRSKFAAKCGSSPLSLLNALREAFEILVDIFKEHPHFTSANSSLPTIARQGTPVHNWGHRFIDDLVQDTIADEDELHQAGRNSED
jgi:hypothetical protein